MKEMLVISAVSMGGIGAALAFFLAYADKKFHVEEDPALEAIAGILPNTNCGGCGYPGCRMLAEAPGRRGPSNACVAAVTTPQEARRALGVGQAMLRGCWLLSLQGRPQRGREGRLTGDMTCANLTGGDKSCSFRCLGYGECVEACKYDAMAMDDNGLPVVFHDKCVGCGACARACPRNIIEMHPEEHRLFVYCRSKDKGAYAKKVCSVACIACGLCVKDCTAAGGIVLKDNLAVINHDLAPQNDESTKRCPTRCILSGIEERVTRAGFYSGSSRRAG